MSGLTPAARAAWEAVDHVATCPDRGVGEAWERLHRAITALLAEDAPEAGQTFTDRDGDGVVSAGQTVQPPAAPAPDTELETLLDNFTDELMSNARATGNGHLVTVRPDRAALRALFAREADARGEVVGTGYLLHDAPHGYYVADIQAMNAEVSAAIRQPGGVPVTLTRRIKGGRNA